MTQKEIATIFGWTLHVTRSRLFAMKLSARDPDVIDKLKAAYCKPTNCFTQGEMSSLVNVSTSALWERITRHSVKPSGYCGKRKYYNLAQWKKILKYEEFYELQLHIL